MSTASAGARRHQRAQRDGNDADSSPESPAPPGQSRTARLQPNPAPPLDQQHAHSVDPLTTQRDIGVWCRSQARSDWSHAELCYLASLTHDHFRLVNGALTRLFRVNAPLIEGGRLELIG